ncbi:acyltransferase domain-containing protein [Mycobacterium sp. WUMAC-067]|uniref:type I polyketide synthase n=1 Tax=unclassified Mycobacterium TaxID=2642494 RepID=UPI001CD98A76|nr:MULTISPECIES: type I polyketide synthase [unclassified Mycobacterium]MCA2241551.1 acyltransferase domain-containing protein [Mycobacterium sp. WUMAC-067]MCA2314265.1 acyltransferase domain-containing protein [Mycobacterium sp. WUMAC-025]
MPSTDVAIIGLACKFPGAAGPDSFWRLIRDGRENTQFGGEAEQFDADFFNLSPREACAMDPRQRLALELTWELFENAFIVPDTLRTAPVSVYLGAMTDDYAALTLRDLAENLDHHTFAGISRAMIANRISYAFGLRGPSMTVDSGQSSSLVAVHLGCESVRTGQSSLAIAGGVHLNLADEIAMLEREFGAVSVSGHTYAFDRRADGYVRGEGAGLVLLKPLPAALHDGDRIHAVIRGSAVANAGHSSAGQTVPSARGEVEVIRRALADAGLEAADIDYVEAHGTGTRVGDAVEAQALGEVFGEHAHDPVLVGSVKTNIGHAGGAAGAAGLLKTVLAIGHSTIPASLNHAGADPETDLNRFGLHVNTAPVPWPSSDHPRRAGVSSFGMGGTNAHLIVEQPPAQPDTPRPGSDHAVPWVLSARSERALTNQAQRLSAYVTERADLTALDVAWSLVSTRTSFEHRAVVVGGDRDGLTTGLAALAAGEPHQVVSVGRATSPGKTVFVFPGQGSQWVGMGRQLYDRFEVFARAFDEAAAAVDGHVRLPLREVMWGADPELLQSTEFAQPALFVLGIALAGLWQSFGVTPDMVMGHSVGEIAAACVAGVLSLPDAARLVAARGRLMARLPAGGVMVAVGAGEAEVTALMDGGVSIAAVNGPHSVVLSGERTPVGALADRLAQSGRRVHRLAVSHAFHSPLMEPMLDEFSAVAAGIEPRRPRIGLVSNLTGLLADAEYGSAQYWTEHVRQPVRFFEGVRAAEAAGAATFVELGPGAALTAAVDQSLSAERAAALATMPKDRPETESILGAAGQMFTRGIGVDWAGVFAGLNARRVELPTYGFARERFWLGAGPGPAGEAGATPAGAVTRSPDLAQQLHALPRDEQQRVLVELVCEHAAAVLGHSGGHAIDHDRAFGDLGFDSLIGVELRNRLTTHTGTALSRTLIFDYPTPAALADHLRRQLLHDDREESDDEKLWSALSKIPVRELRRTGLLDKLLLLAGMPQTPVGDANDPRGGGDDIDSLSPDDLIAMALNSADDEDIE